MGRVVALTGATGLVGGRLLERHIESGDEVRVLSRRPAPEALRSRPEVRWAVGDLTDPAAPLEALADGADVLYHCAGELRDVARMHEIHVEGTRRLLAAARGRVSRWVQLSSVGVYGPRRRGTVTEDTAPDPRGPYETTKLAADTLVQQAHAEGWTRAVILRPSIVFGEGMPSPFLLQLVAAIRRGLFFFIGPPGASVNYVSAWEVARALALCGLHPEAASVYNLSDHATLEDFVSWVCDELAVAAPRARLPASPVRLAARALGPLPGFPLTVSRVDALTTRVRYAVERIEQRLGYRATESLEDGIRRFVRSCSKGTKGSKRSGRGPGTRV